MLNENEWSCRTELLIGKENFNKLQTQNVLIVGLGGVGGYAAELLCRAGIGRFTLVDNDIFHISNRNRQLGALVTTEGKLKTEIYAERLRNIFPRVELNLVNDYLVNEKIPQILSQPFDYIVDAIDTLGPKVYFLKEAVEKKYKIVSAMGAAGKLNASLVQVSDISKSFGCKLAYYIRKKLHSFNIREGFKVVFSPEVVPRSALIVQRDVNKNSVVGTISYLPALFGCFCASVVINDLIVS